jgi:alkanesulfonate monooxygenase SsuD/methylene tetrahydromethanopterin reductase-like flavin-dependent oxidoreductase (luciferase family)
MYTGATWLRLVSGDMSGIRLGVVVTTTRPWRQLRDDFVVAEELGYDAAYVYDHLTHPTAAGRWLADGFTTLAAAATVTSRIGVGTLVASATLHSPVALARLAATVDDVSGGRLVLGLGAGSPRCALADRGESPTWGEMYRRLEDVVVGMRAVFDGDPEWQGRERSFAGLESTAVPEGARPPYLLLAGHGPRTIDLVARYADGWNTFGGPGSTQLEPDDFWALIGEQSAAVSAACERHDRDPATLRRSLLLGYGTVRPTDSVESYGEAVDRASELGFDEVVVYGPFDEPGNQFWSDRTVHERALATIRN